MKISECKRLLEFIVVAVCKGFDLDKPGKAIQFIAGGVISQYAYVIQDTMGN